MSRGRNIWLTVAGAIAIVTAILMLRMEHRAETIRSQLVTLAQKRSDSEVELQKLRQTLAGLDQDQPRLKPQPEEAPRPSFEGVSLAEQAKRRSVILRSWFSLEYGPFCRAAGLTPDQIKKFEGAVVAHGLRASDVLDVAKEQGLPGRDQAVQSFWKPENAQFIEDEKDALGSSAYQQFQQYERTEVVKSVADAVAGMVFDSGEPLSSQQAAALTQILANNSTKYQNGNAATLDDLNMATAVAQAQKILKPNQLAALQTSLTARTAVQKLNSLLASAANQANVSNGAPAPSSKK